MSLLFTHPDGHEIDLTHGVLTVTNADSDDSVPVPIGQRAVGWPANEVAEINAARIRGDSDDQIKALVAKLHNARMVGTDEPFKTDWFDCSTKLKKQAAKRVKCTTLATA